MIRNFRQKLKFSQIQSFLRTNIEFRPTRVKGIEREVIFEHFCSRV